MFIIIIICYYENKTVKRRSSKDIKYKLFYVTLSTIVFIHHVPSRHNFRDIHIKFIDLGLFVMFNKSMNLIRRLNREKFHFSSQRCQLWCLISGTEVRKSYKISAQYL